MAAKVATWVWVLVGIAVVVVLGLVAVAGVGFYEFSRHFETTAATATDAASEFDAVRARFAGQEPLLERTETGGVARTRREAPVEAPAVRPTELHLLGFDPSDGRLVRFKVPFWLLRMGGAKGSIDLNGEKVTLDELDVTVEDLERLGPALVLDHRTPKGERVIVWTQ